MKPLRPTLASLPLLAVACLALCLTGCDVRPVETATVGAAPPVRVPVGPVPGPRRDLVAIRSPYHEDPIALMQGRKLFVWYNCAGCHGGHGGGGMGPSLRDATWLYGSSDAHVFDSIAEGRPHGMPAWGLSLPEEHIWKLTSYVQSLGTSYEPKPPLVAPPKVNVPPEDMNLRRGE